MQNLNPQAAAPLHILAVSGSLREASSNTTLLRAAASLAPASVKITLYDGMGELPHFNPDLDGDSPPPAVIDWRAQLQAADAVLICSPEYAHGVPGSLKNALDWIVGSGEFMGKPVTLLNASLSSTHAQASLTETLTVMMAKVNAVRVPLRSNKLDEAAMVANPEIADTLRAVILALAEAAASRAA